MTETRAPSFLILSLAFTAALLAFVGAMFSTSGFAKLFAGAPLSVALMTGALELGKIVSLVFLHQFWRQLGVAVKACFITVILLLTLITSAGIFGFLTQALQEAAVGARKAQTMVERLEVLDQSTHNDLEKARAEQAPTADLERRELEIKVATEHSREEKRWYQAQLGPVSVISEIFHIDLDLVARGLILLCVCILEPLVLCLVLATSWTLQSRVRPQPS